MGVYISIHALLAESDMSGTDFYRSAIISIHALLAESDLFCGAMPTASLMISIHALLAESDTITGGPGTTISPFLSTLSLRRATQLVRYLVKSFCISIHALLAESDQLKAVDNNLTLYFYPRSPCGERHGTPMPSFLT